METEVKKRVLGRPFGPDNPPPKSPGRPRKRPVTESIDDLLRSNPPREVIQAMRKFGCKDNATWADVFASCLAREALKGNVLAIKEAREATEGKAPQRIELQTREDKSIEIAVVFEGPVPERTLPAPAVSDSVIDVEPEKPAETTEKSSEDHK